jgi:hypothetical protein
VSSVGSYIEVRGANQTYTEQTIPGITAAELSTGVCVARQFELYPSRKAGINTREGYIVTQGRTVYLRITGALPSYRLETATASEDNGEFLVCDDRVRLTSAAYRFGLEMGVRPSYEKDRFDREYVVITPINYRPGNTPAEDAADRAVLDKWLNRFFEIYATTDPSKTEQLNEMKEVYDVLAVDQSGGDVYLSDGIWLSSDGSVHDRGR